MGFKSARTKTGMSVVQAAKALNVSCEAIFCWERGQYLPESRRLPEIAALYHCTIDELMNGGE